MRESNDPEAKQVLGELKLRGVMIELDEESVIRAIESILNRYLPCYWGTVIPGITSAIKRELVRSRNTIDADLVREVDEYFKKQGKKKQGMGDEWSDEDEPEDSDVGSEEEEEEESDSEDDMTEEAKPKEEEKKIDHLKDDPTTRKRMADVLTIHQASANPFVVQKTRLRLFLVIKGRTTGAKRPRQPVSLTTSPPDYTETTKSV